jgi:hypothetical protein
MSFCLDSWILVRPSRGNAALYIFATVSLYVIPAASKLRRMLKDTKDLIVCPGVYDGLSDCDSHV